MGMQPRISRENLFMEVAHLVGERSTCKRAKVGVVATLEGRIIATGYNGAPKGMPHCLDVDCDIQMVRSHALQPVIRNLADAQNIPDRFKYKEEVHCVRAVHAEANLIAWSARTGTSLLTSELYCTHQPCYTCCKLLINAGVSAIHYCEKYGDESSIELLREANVLVWHEESC
jgi:dCMP deaminase